MAFLLFAYRKLSLKRQINQKNYQMTLLSNQQQSIQSQIGMMEQVKASAQDSWATISNQLSTNMNTIFQTSVADSNDKTYTLGQDYQKALLAKQGMKPTDEGYAEADTKAKDIKAQMEALTADENQKLKAAYFGQQAAQQSLLVANQAVNSVFAAGDNAKLAMLQHQDQRIGIAKEQLESEVKVISAEYENVKKAESEEAKNVAPTFGLA